MVNSSNKNYLIKRRGISTIVGGIIFVVLLTAGFSTFFVAMDVQSDTINAQRTISNSIIDKTQEKFTIAAATDDSTPWPTLGLQVKNEGPNPVQISNIWIINKSDPNYPVKNIPVKYNDAFIPPGYGISILETQPLKMINPALTPFQDLYDIKVVSALGTVKQTELNVGGNNYLLAEMFTIPPDVRLNENVTVALRITNVGPTLITGISPTPLLVDGAEITIPSPHPWVDGVPELVSPVSIPADLKPSESTIFSWHSKLNTAGLIGGKIKFSSSATGTESLTGFTVNSNTASDKLTVRDPKGGAGEEIVIRDELFAKPDIFMLIPSTFGESDDNEGLWGVTVANPTDATMYVSKVSVTILYAGANSNQEIFTSGNGCADRTPLSPVTDYWSCPNDNSLVWYDEPAGAFKQPIAPRSAYTFLLTVEPGKMTGSGDALDSVIVHTAVFTTLGAFGEAKWTSSAVKGGDAIANVFLVETGLDPTNKNNYRANRMLIGSGSTQTFDIALADLSPNADKIQNGAELIINIPKDWGLPTINDAAGFTNVVVNQFPDNSYQIVGELINNLDDDAEVISFDSVAPTVLCDKMYVMHVLANGITVAQNTIGPVAEIVLQVNPVGACP
jgi:hypothetical protein